MNLFTFSQGFRICAPTQIKQALCCFVVWDRHKSANTGVAIWIRVSSTRSRCGDNSWTCRNDDCFGMHFMFCWDIFQYFRSIACILDVSSVLSCPINNFAGCLQGLAVAHFAWQELTRKFPVAKRIKSYCSAKNVVSLIITLLTQQGTKFPHTRLSAAATSSVVCNLCSSGTFSSNPGSPCLPTEAGKGHWCSWQGKLKTCL